MKKLLTTIILVALLATIASATVTPFQDIPNDTWYTEAVTYCYENGLMNGTDTTHFSPDSPITYSLVAIWLGSDEDLDIAKLQENPVATRGEFIETLWRRAGSPSSQISAPFFDLSNISQNTLRAINWAYENGIITGKQDNCFEANKPATRAEAAVILMRYDITLGLINNYNHYVEPIEIDTYEELTDTNDYVDPATKRDYSVIGDGYITSLGDGVYIKDETLSTTTKNDNYDDWLADDEELVIENGMGYIVKKKKEEPKYSLNELLEKESIGVCNMLYLEEEDALLITDTNNHKIWKYQDGQIKVYAGSDTLKDANEASLGGYRDGSADKSQFNNPWGIAKYADGYAVTDSENNAIRLIDGNMVRTVRGLISHPTGIASDEDGNLYISDTVKGMIYKLDKEKELTTIAYNLDAPMGLCYKDNTLYIAENGANKVSKISTRSNTKRVITVAGKRTEGNKDGSIDIAELSGPVAVAVADDGTVYVSDAGNNAIRCVKDGKVSTIDTRDYGTKDLDLMDIAGLIIADGKLLVCDNFSKTVLEYPIG